MSLPSSDFDFRTSVNLYSLVLTAQQVESKLKALDPHKGMGPDSLPPAVIKYCSPVLAPHLSIFFDTLLESGTFPANLKISFITPIFKSGKRSNVTNYRPIAIQSVLAKVSDSLVVDKLVFNLKHVIAEERHGFRSGRSASTNMLVLHNYVTSAFFRRR
ncbi:uncharacterized protein LOC124371044 [Homalodisca vitripennis]|uniref:uncharacterized protein LOC124371044 n=1 Tax=Homalodisca vitripennis TaxID=197043 RepID=UPI001EEBF576|nr:uncharacterized protein LOC124371044 [Homalodisca vitripennis]